MNYLLNKVIKIAQGAGELILDHYFSEDSYHFELKQDGSPVTNADMEAHFFITKSLRDISPWPILTEEDPIEYDVRKQWQTFWLVDPLDGTKDFIAKNDHFTVNIALVTNHMVVMGVIFAPALNEMYFAEKNKGAYLMTRHSRLRIPVESHADLRVAKSCFHDNALLREFIEMNKIHIALPIGSSLKFCKLATGELNLYPRFVGSSEWDIAAGHIIIKEAGCQIINLSDKREPTYNKLTLRNPHFLTHANSINLSQLKFPRKMGGVVMPDC